MNCQICGNSGMLVLRKGAYQIVKCKTCKHYYTDLKVTSSDVQKIYDDDYFFGGKDGYDDYTLEGKMLEQRGEYYANKIKKIISTGKVLDVGAAAGFILKGFENKGWQGTGIEPNAKMVAYGKNKLNINLHKGTLETITSENKYDLVVMIQVIAHLFDLNSAIKKAHESLNKKGYILVETWNKNSITAKIFGKNWHEFSPPTTLNFFDKKTLDKLMLKHGFIKVRTGRPEKKILSNHAKSILKHKLKDIRLFKNITGMVNLIPNNTMLPYPAEDLFWTLYQKK